MCAQSVKTKLEESLNCKRNKAGFFFLFIVIYRGFLIYRNIGVLLRGIDILVTLNSGLMFSLTEVSPT